MRVCLVTGYPPSRGRLSEYAKDMVDALTRQEEVEGICVITSASRGGERRIGEKLVVKSLWRVDNLLSPLKVLFTILRLRPDIVHFNVHLASFGRGRLVNFAWSLLIPLLALFRVKTMVCLHNLSERIRIEEAGLKDSLLNRLGLSLATRFYAFSSLMIVTMRSYVETIRRRYGKKAFYVPHGTNFFNYSSTNNRNTPSSKPGGNGQNMLFMGYVGPYKDVDLLLDAFRLVKARKPWVKLLFSGSVHPNYPEVIRRVAAFRDEPSVVFLGYTPEEKLPAVLRETGVVVLPYSTCTGTSGVLHYLASFRKPMVATDLPEFRELRDEGAGLMLVERDPEAFSEAIIRLMEDETLYTALGDMNQAFSKDRAWDRVGQDYVRLYKAALNHRDAWR